MATDPITLVNYRGFGIPKGWTLLIGRLADVDVIRRKPGFCDNDPVIGADIRQHSGRVRIGNQTLNRWAICPVLALPKEIMRVILHIKA